MCRKKSTCIGYFFLIALGVIPASCKKENVNQAPIADAGSKQELTLPADFIKLDGSKSYDPDGNIASYLWTKIDAPGTFSFSINDPDKATAWVYKPVAGIYHFNLMVTDNRGLSATDIVEVKVNPANVPPSPPPPPPPPPAYWTESFYNLRWQASAFDSGVKLVLPTINHNLDSITSVSSTHEYSCAPGTDFCLPKNFINVEKDGGQRGIIYYRIENERVVLYIRFQDYHTYTGVKETVKVTGKLG